MCKDTSKMSMSFLEVDPGNPNESKELKVSQSLARGVTLPDMLFDSWLLLSDLGCLFAL
jgi:hypothetical protein